MTDKNIKYIGLVAFIVIITVFSPVGIDASESLPQAEEPPNDSVEYKDHGMNKYQASVDDYDADFWFGVKNTHNKTLTIESESTPILKSGKRLDTRYDDKTAESGEVIEIDNNWDSFSNQEARIQKVEVAIYSCDRELLSKNCTKISENIYEIEETVD